VKLPQIRDVGIRATGLYMYNKTERPRDSSIQSSPHTAGKPKRIFYFTTTGFDPAKMGRFGCGGLEFNSEIKVNL
jgi:hypothetical protein